MNSSAVAIAFFIRLGIFKQNHSTTMGCAEFFFWPDHNIILPGLSLSLAGNFFLIFKNHFYTIINRKERKYITNWRNGKMVEPTHLITGPCGLPAWLTGCPCEQPSSASSPPTPPPSTHSFVPLIDCIQLNCEHFFFRRLLLPLVLGSSSNNNNKTCARINIYFNLRFRWRCWCCCCWWWERLLKAACLCSLRGIELRFYFIDINKIWHNFMDFFLSQSVGLSSIRPFVCSFICFCIYFIKCHNKIMADNQGQQMKCRQDHHPIELRNMTATTLARGEGHTQYEKKNLSP